MDQPSPEPFWILSKLQEQGSDLDKIGSRPNHEKNVSSASHWVTVIPDQTQSHYSWFDALARSIAIFYLVEYPRLRQGLSDMRHFAQTINFMQSDTVVNRELWMAKNEQMGSA
jgi:hypothetical protein